MPTSQSTLEPTAIDGLLATPPAALPFGPSLQVRSYVLRRDAGNLAVYNSPGLGAAADAIRDLGGVERVLVGHEHESMFGSQDVGAEVWIHDRDAPAASALPIGGTFTGSETLGHDLEVIPAPGHTPGTTVYLWATGEHRCLFSGDGLWYEGDAWQVAVLGSSDRAAYLESLAMIRELDFDVLVPWAVPAGDAPLRLVTRDDARRQLDAVIARVEDGADR